MMNGDIDIVNKNPIMSKSTSLYRILSLLLIINYYKKKWGRKPWKGLDMRLIQVYLWGLSGSENADCLSRIGRNGLFPDIPFTYNASVMQLFAYCCVNGFLSTEKASGDTVYDLTPKAYVLLTTLNNDDLRNEIDGVLEKIGVITKESMKQLRIDWRDVAY